MEDEERRQVEDPAQSRERSGTWLDTMAQKV